MKFVGMLVSVILMLSVVGLNGCGKRNVYLRGTSEVISVERGDEVDYPQSWTGAWLISDEALIDLLDAAEVCE